MTRDEAQRLLSGYATGSLSESEQRQLFAAALEDQELFDQLGEEQSLKELIELPGARDRLLAALEPAPAKQAVWWPWAAVAAGLAAVTVWVLIPSRVPEPATVAQAPAVPPAVAIVETPPAPKDEPKALRAQSQQKGGQQAELRENDAVVRLRGDTFKSDVAPGPPLPPAVVAPVGPEQAQQAQGGAIGGFVPTPPPPPPAPATEAAAANNLTLAAGRSAALAADSETGAAKRAGEDELKQSEALAKTEVAVATAANNVLPDAPRGGPGAGAPGGGGGGGKGGPGAAKGGPGGPGGGKGGAKGKGGGAPGGGGGGRGGGFAGGLGPPAGVVGGVPSPIPHEFLPNGRVRITPGATGTLRVTAGEREMFARNPVVPATAIELPVPEGATEIRMEFLAATPNAQPVIVTAPVPAR